MLGFVLFLFLLFLDKSKEDRWSMIHSPRTPLLSRLYQRGSSFWKVQFQFFNPEAAFYLATNFQDTPQDSQHSHTPECFLR